MSLREELRQELLAFAQGRVSERELFLWLGGAGRAISREDEETQSLWAAASGLLSEVSGVEHDAGDVRRDIADLVSGAPTVGLHMLSVRSSAWAAELMPAVSDVPYRGSSSVLGVVALTSVWHHGVPVGEPATLTNRADSPMH